MSEVASFPSELFDSWAEVYDEQPNPLLSLERRVLEPLLGNIRGLDILDAGCGTGRWLQHLVDGSPRSLVGVDISAAMLLLAANKMTHGCDLRLGNCIALPVRDASADILLSSFVVSYLNDLDGFAREVDRVTRPGATVFLTDMHPDTEASLHWKRVFADTQMYGQGWSLDQITSALEARGIKLVSLIEPAFGVEERQIFEQCGRLDLYEFAAGRPAIYVMQLRKSPSSQRPRFIPQGTAGSIRLTGGRCARGPDAASIASISIVGGTIHLIHPQTLGRTPVGGAFLETILDLADFLVLPGLVNPHDHLDFGLFPNIGDGPYNNATEWARDIHARHARLIAHHRKVPHSLRLWWGIIRNLLCGVTTVCHHNPITQELLHPELPVRVVAEFAWAHSLSLEPDFAARLAERRAGVPFILHAAEGVDEESTQEVFELDRLHALDHRTVLVHGLGCNPEAVALLNRRQTGVIICPTSNRFLFDHSPSLGLIHTLDKVALGSDSPLTAAGDLLDEIRFARERIGVDANSLYSMVTHRSAEILRLRRGEGRLQPGAVADLLVVQDRGLSPAETLARLTMEDIEMVMLAGRVQLAGPLLFERLPDALKGGLQPLDVDGQRRWVRAPIDKLLMEAEKALGSGLRLGGKRVRFVPAA